MSEETPAAPEPAHNADMPLPRTERHHQLMLAIADWLGEDDIIRVMRQTGVMTREGEALLIKRLPKLSEPELLAYAAAMLRDRRVRLIVAKHTAQAYGMPKASAMKGLLDIVKWGKPADPVPAKEG